MTKEMDNMDNGVLVLHPLQILLFVFFGALLFAAGVFLGVEITGCAGGAVKLPI